MPLSAKRVLRTFRYAMYFDGIDDYVLNAGFNWSVLQGGYTIVLWLNAVDRDGHIVRHYITPQGYYYIAYSSAYKRLSVLSRSTDTNELYIADQSTYKNQPNVFNYAVLTWDTALGCWYANGVPDRCVSDLRTGKGIAYTGFYIGRPYGAPWYCGYIFQLLIYSRVLSGSEIAWNYNNPDNPVRNGLVLWLQAHPAYIKDIDGDGVLEWIDLSGFNNHGKIYGAQLVELVKTAKRVLTPARVLRATR
jgi:hypothetical protein